MQLANLVAAAQDLQTASELKPNESLQQEIAETLAVLGHAVALLPPEHRQAFWNTKLTTKQGRHAMRDVALFGKIKQD